MSKQLFFNQHRCVALLYRIVTGITHSIQLFNTNSMALVDLIMPKLGESIMEATILKWHKKPGDAIKEDETVLDIATDKVDSEVPSTTTGVLEEILFKENDVVPIGTVIAKIRVGASSAVTQSQAAAPLAAQEYEEAKLVEEVPYQPSQFVVQSSAPVTNNIRFYSPLVLNIAQQEGINMTELGSMEGTGQDGRVSKKDILAYVAAKASGNQQIVIINKTVTEAVTDKESSSNQVAVSNNTGVATANYSGNVEVIEMDRMRKIIAKHMVDSKHTSAHVTSFADRKSVV